MSGDDEQRSETLAKAQAQREGDLVANRIEELHENPIKGDFDAAHLKAVHAYIFQDLPKHQPGVMREDTPDWTKHRGLEEQRGSYDVPYVSHDVEGHIADVLSRFGGPGTLKGLAPDAAAERFAEFYSDLDHSHGFYEGNSRTLREFTRELALEGGFRLDWAKTEVGERERNELYLARDLAVYEREFPGLTEARAMQTDDRREYEAYFTIERLRAAVGERTLEAILSEGLSPSQHIEQQQGVGEEADAVRDFQGVGHAIEEISERVLVAIGETAAGAIDTLADDLAELLGGGRSRPEPRSRSEQPIETMSATERREARIRAMMDAEQQQREAQVLQFLHNAYSADELRQEGAKRDRSEGRGY